MFRKTIDFCVKNGFLKLIEYPIVNTFELKLGPFGGLLKENLKKEWFDNFINYKEFSIFNHQSDLKTTFNYIKDLTQQFPLGFIETIPITKENLINIENFKLDAMHDNTKYFNDFFLNDTNLIYTLFVKPSEGQIFFHQIQKQRKIWWRKISASPGRYYISDIQNNENESEFFVNIEAKYPWGNQILETINLNLKTHQGLSNQDLMVKDGKKLVPAVSIKCNTKLSNLFLNSLCDAYDEVDFHNEKRKLLRFHRKIAPYKISFIIPQTNSETMKELQDLAEYLTKLLRNNYITSLFLPWNVKRTLEGQQKQYDELGIPYNIHLKESTLKDGISYLRSRDTTLKEQVHVADLVSYIEKIYKTF